MMITRMRNLLTAVVCLFGVMTAQAQFTGTVNQVPRDDWAPEPATFQAAEVGQALGTDAAGLLAALNSWMAEGSTDPNMFFYAPPSAPDTWSDGYTTGGEKGFWLDTEAEIISYPNGAYYCNPVWDEEASTFSINIGMMPNMLKYGIYNKELKFSLQYNGQVATFTIDFTVTGGEKAIPEPATIVEKELNVVGETAIDVQQYPRTDYSADAIYVAKFSEILAKIGAADTASIKSNIAELLWCTEFDTETIDKKAELTQNSTAGAPGWWTTDIREGGEGGKATGECAATGYGQGNKFFVEGFSYDTVSDSLYCRLGQYPGVLKSEEKYFVNIYAIYGDKAYRLRYNLEVLLKEAGNGLEGMTKVGETTVVVEQEPTSDYSTKAVKPDLDAIAAALGWEVSEMTVKALDGDNSFAASTANNGGWWFDSEGRVTAWGANSVMFVEPTNAPDSQNRLSMESWNVGQYPNALSVGDERTAYLYFTNGGEGDKYYTYAVTLKVVEPKQVSDEFTNVRTISFGVQAIPSASAYPIEEKWTIDPVVLESILGTSDVKLYGLATDANAEATGSIYSDKYSCDPKPGFWLDAEGRVSTWSSSTPVGICYAADGTFQFFQYPGVNNVGDVFKTQLFLVNVESGEMITFNISVSFVESIVKAEIVGEEELILPVSTEEMTVPIDMNKPAEALGVTVADLMDDQNSYLHGMTDANIYGQGCNTFDGLGFDLNGYYDIEGSILIVFEEDGDDILLNISSLNAVPDNFIATGKFCFQIDNKQYVYNVRFVSPATFTGISEIGSGKSANSKYFDLQGRQVFQPKRGLYIMNGKKVIVK